MTKTTAVMEAIDQAPVDRPGDCRADVAAADDPP
jgi:hypothetical protein